MAKIVLPDASNGNSGTQRINDNFRKVAEALNDKVLFRDNPAGEPNEMNNDLDMNSKRVYNLPVPTLDHEATPWGEVKGGVPAAKKWAEEAKESALESAESADQSAASALVATEQAERAEAAAVEAENVLQGAVKKVDLGDDVDPTKGAALVGFDGSTVDAVLDNAQSMADYAALRAYAGRAKGVRLTTLGIDGIFQRDDADTTTTDDGVVVIVDAIGRRWKRSGSGPLNVEWFGAKGDGVTSDQTAIAAAVQYANTKGVPLYWPSKPYLSTASILNFWDVAHTGDGRIVRGTDTFYINNIGKTSHIYIDVALRGALAANDGLTPDKPVLPNNINTIFRKFEALDGNYQFNFLPGEYVDVSTHRITLGGNQYSENYIRQNGGWLIFAGPSVGYDPLTNATPLPAVTFGRASISATVIGWNIKNLRCVVRDIKFVGYDGSSSSGGLSFTGGVVQLINVHTFKNMYAISAFHCEDFGMLGGIIEGNNKSGTGVRSQFLTKHSIGSQGNAASKTPIFKNLDYGMLVQEGATGHADFCTFQNNNIGCAAIVNSRINCNGSDFQNNAIAVSSRDGGNVFIPANVNFNVGTALSNGQNVTVECGDIVASDDVLNYKKYEFLVSKLFPNTVVSSTVTNVGEVKLFDWWLESTAGLSYRVNKAAKIKVYGSITGTNGDKTFSARLGTAANVTNGGLLVGSVIQAGSSGGFVAEFEVNFLGNNAQVSHTKFSTSLGTITSRAGAARSSIVVNSAGEKYLSLCAVTANAADSIEIYGIDFSLS